MLGFGLELDAGLEQFCVDAVGDPKVFGAPVDRR